MTLQEQYNKIKAGKGSKHIFLTEAKKQFSNMLTNPMGFEEASSILKQRGVITENYVDLQPINTIEASPKEEWENKFAQFLSEIKNEAKEENIKAEAKKVDKSVEETQDHNFDYKDQKNLDNQIGQEVLNGIYFEAKQNPDKSLDELRKIVSKNLEKDRQYYMKNAAFGIEGLGYQETEVEEVSGKYKASGYSDKLKKLVKEALVKKPLNEQHFDDLEAAKDYARSESEQGFVQHVNKNSKGGFRVEDWYDSDTTVASYEGGDILEQDYTDNPNDKYLKSIKRIIQFPDVQEDPDPHFSMGRGELVWNYLTQKFPELNRIGEEEWMQINSLVYQELKKQGLNEDHTGNPNDKYVVRPCKNEQEPWAVWEGEKRVKGFANKADAKAFADKKNKEQGLEENIYGTPAFIKGDNRTSEHPKWNELSADEIQAYIDDPEYSLWGRSLSTAKMVRDRKRKEEQGLEESYDEFQRDDKGSKDVTAKDKGEEEAYGAGVKKGEKIEKKKMKSESLDDKLNEIDRQSQIVALEAKLDAIDEMIESKNTRLNMIDEDANLAELVDKTKIKQMQKEIKILEKRKIKMEKMYEKMCGKSYTKEEIVDETYETNE